MSKTLSAWVDWLKRVYLKALLRHLLSLLVQEMKDFVIEVVSELDAEDLLDEEKRKVAFNTLQRYAQLRGKEIKQRALNLAIELAVALIRQQ